jgi:hypothetical protein
MSPPSPATARADPRLDQFLDRLDRFGVLGVEELAIRDAQVREME